MAVEGENLAIIAAHDLVNAVAEVHAPVVIGRVELVVRDDFVACHCDFHAHNSSKLLTILGIIGVWAANVYKNTELFALQAQAGGVESAFYFRHECGAILW